MKLCTSHLYDLVKALNQKGLGHLITQDAVPAKIKAERWLAGIAKADEFDPLIVSIFEISKKAMEAMLDRSMPRPQDRVCPLCVMNHVIGPACDREWTDNITDLMVVTARTNNLMEKRILL